MTHSFIFEEYLHGLFRRGDISLETAQYYATDQSVFDQMHLGTCSPPRLDSIKHTHDMDH